MCFLVFGFEGRDQLFLNPPEKTWPIHVVMIIGHLTLWFGFKNPLTGLILPLPLGATQTLSGLRIFCNKQSVTSHGMNNYQSSPSAPRLVLSARFWLVVPA